MLKIICVGKIKEKYLKDAIDEYSKRISKYNDIKLIEINDETTTDINKNLKKEEEQIRKYIDIKDYVIALDIDGKELTSQQLATTIDNIFNYNSNITFIIGGSYGISDNLKKEANLRLSFSKLTFPHQLFRVILLEQIYRSFKIINNEVYHK